MRGGRGRRGHGSRSRGRLGLGSGFGAWTRAAGFERRSGGGGLGGRVGVDRSGLGGGFSGSRSLGAGLGEFAGFGRLALAVTRLLDDLDALERGALGLGLGGGGRREGGGGRGGGRLHGR